MKLKQFIIGGVVVLGLGLGIFALIKSPRATHDSDDETVQDDVPPLVTVQTGTLRRLTLHRYVSGYGTVDPAPATANEPAAGAQLAAPAAGVVTKVNFVEGRQVEKGDVLVELNSSSATAEYAEQELERQEKLYAQHNASLKNLQDARTQLALLRVTAPLSGTLTRLNVKPGAAVDGSTVVAEVMDLSRLAVSAGIPASEAGRLKTGETVQVLAGSPVTATLSFVSPAVDVSNGTVLTRALLPADSGLRPGEFVSVRIVTEVHTNDLAAPAESVVTDESGNSVISLVNGAEAIQMRVQTGLREDNWVEITGAGLREGDSVVTVGAYGLPDKAKLQIANSPDETLATNPPEAQ